MTRNTGRSVAEWTTLAGSCAVLFLVISLIVFQMRGELEPPAPVAALTGEVRVVDGRHHVGVEVENNGDLTAANVQVSAELIVGETEISADQTILFLVGGETADVVFVFDLDPAVGELSVTVGAYVTR